VAGPEPQDGRPPGTVFVAVAGPGVDRVVELAEPGDRDAVRAAAVGAAVRLLGEVVRTTVG
jgi:nicotinamide-nucleotide amidase